MVLTALKITFLKTKPKQINDRDYRQFSLQDFMEKLKGRFTPVQDCVDFDSTFLSVLNNHALLKTSQRKSCPLCN